MSNVSKLVIFCQVQLDLVSGTTFLALFLTRCHATNLEYSDMQLNLEVSGMPLTTFSTFLKQFLT